MVRSRACAIDAALSFLSRCRRSVCATGSDGGMGLETLLSFYSGLFVHHAETAVAADDCWPIDRVFVAGLFL